jgi:hypothetical protein
MKKMILFGFSLILALLYSCTSQNALDPKTVEEIVSGNQFTFMATKAIPANYDVINIMNSMPNAAASRILDLSYGYTVVLKEKEIEVTLPYFGRTFTPSYDTSKNSFRFTTNNFNLTKNQNKKGNWIFIIAPKDAENVKNIYLEVYKNGNAYISVDANDRQPISYDGYMMKNEIKKN